MKNPFRIGKRIYLRPLEPEDATALLPWANDDEVTRFLLLWRPQTLADERAFIERARTHETNVTLAIALRRDDRLIGSAGFHVINLKDRTATFGIMIGDKREWGRGYGTEATQMMVDYGFDTLNLNRIDLRVTEYNPRGIGAYEKVGFIREGVLRSDTYREGRYWNTILMSILRDEWEARRRTPPREGPKTARSKRRPPKRS